MSYLVVLRTSVVSVRAMVGGLVAVQCSVALAYGKNGSGL